MAHQPKLTMTKGLPGSGKSTWARAEILGKDPNQVIKRVNKDDLRTMADASQHSRANEKAILKMRDLLVNDWLKDGWDVIVDDTNLAPKHETRLREIAFHAGAKFYVKDFTDVPVEECIRRDLERTRSVGEQVIRKTWRQFLFQATPVVPAPAHKEGLPPAIIVDIDGTVCQIGDRSPYDASKCHLDTPKPPVIKVIQGWIALQVDRWSGAGPAVVFCSGRSAAHRKETEEWLREHVWPHIPLEFAIELRMRPEFITDTRPSSTPKADHRKDSVVKLELYKEHIEPYYNIDYVLDDRTQVVEMWRSLGLTCLQVAWGDF